ncbi:MAG: hypothetical protein ACLRVQ_02950 [Lachnospiraceae bacterium]
MKTLEAAYIFPIIFTLTCFSIIFTLQIHDNTISETMQYGILIEQAVSLENSWYGPSKAYTEKTISDIINNSYIINNRSSFSACLSGNTLYIKETGKKDCLSVEFSNYERCNTIRKETALILQYLNK